jgi:uncharacterized membrane protein
MATPKTSRSRRLPYVLQVILVHWRLAVTIVLALVVMTLLPCSSCTLATRLLVGWNIGVVLYLVLAYWLIARASVDDIPINAAREDEGRLAILILTVLAAIASLGGILAELTTNPGVHRTPVQLALSAITILLSWAFTHTIFALHYAHDFYGEHGGKKSGLDFPGKDAPDYWDFVYFSFVIGMTSQVSDVRVTSRLIRSTVTAHGIVSFFFNAAVLALTVNIAASTITTPAQTGP